MTESSNSIDINEKYLKNESITALFQLIVVLSYLDIPHLLQNTCDEVANRVRVKNPKQIDAMFSPSEVPVKLSYADTLAYDGKNYSLIHNLSCFSCEKEEIPDKLFTCSRCGISKYCSKDCQKEDFTLHKKSCKQIKYLKDKLEILAEELHHQDDWDGREENLFETSVGDFWGLDDPRDYCCTRLELADEILHVAHDYERISIFDIAISHYLELMRLSHSDNQGCRSRTPFILLSMDRDDDAYNFIKWWESVPGSDYDWGDPPPVREGEWSYLTNQNRYEDMFTVCDKLYSGELCSDMDLCFLAALALIKFRILAKHEQRLKEYEALLPHMERLSVGNTLTNVLHIIKEKLVGDKDWIKLMREQEDHLNKYLEMIQKSNKTFLPAVVNPAPLRSQPCPGEYSEGSVEEAWLTLDYSWKLFHITPGAVQRIKGIVGNNPQYDITYMDIYC